jgi:hypothetical protein
MNAGCVEKSSGPESPAGTYLLWVTGDEVDFVKLQQIIDPVQNFVLGPFAWLVHLPAGAARRFQNAASAAIPIDDGNAGLLLVRLAVPLTIHRNGDGLGLAQWLHKIGFLNSLPR